MSEREELPPAFYEETIVDHDAIGRDIHYTESAPSIAEARLEALVKSYRAILIAEAWDTSRSNRSRSIKMRADHDTLETEFLAGF